MQISFKLRIVLTVLFDVPKYLLVSGATNGENFGTKVCNCVLRALELLGRSDHAIETACST